MRRFARWPAYALLLVSALAAPSCSDETGDGETGDEHGDDVADQWNKSYESQDVRDECSGVRVPDRNGFAKRVALTFDDGPNPATTPKVLDVLKAHDIKATFLINGSRVTSQAAHDIIDRALAEGHLVGNHTHNHQNATELSESAFRQQVERTDAILREHEITPKWFRFPFGASSCGTANAVRGYGYTIAGWHVDSADWCFASGGGECPRSTFRHVDDRYRDDMAALTLSQVESTGGGIVLFHDIHANTANSLEGIIETLEDRGFTFVNVDDAATFPLLNGKQPSTQWIGSTCTDDASCDFDEAALCLDGDGNGSVCTLACNGTCPDKSGYGVTFCAAVEGEGVCARKADASNRQCADLPGTVATPVERFIGTSTATAATATVCLP
jgi:peptidoglycan/xylan/chitin deacetylase (PgdA/CDA1 family)